VADPLDALREMIRAVVREELQRMAPDYLTTAQAARVASLTQDTIREWIQSGRLRSVRAGRAHRIKRADLDAALALPRRVETAAPESIARRKFG
jgi:excisionase family DNA binding protein